jgi:hypothetical protein
MPGIEEASSARTPIGSDLAEGVKAIALNQEITFTLYAESILPLDEYRFWVRVFPVKTLKAIGSLHYGSERQQEVDGNYTLNRVVFTSLQEVNPLNAISPTTMWIAEFDGIMFAFTARGSFYQQSGLHHYVGNAVYPDMATQVIKSAGDLQTDRVIVSNSLPLWLAINNFQPLNSGLGFACPVRMYPSLLSPNNLHPPFATIDIPPDTMALSSSPFLNSQKSHHQLVTERVKITLWGLRNDEALTFLDCIIRYSLNYGTFGIMNMPVPRDEKRKQSELLTIAQKKSVEFEISYYQFTARSVAQQLIEAVQMTFIVPGLETIT